MSRHRRFDRKRAEPAEYLTTIEDVVEHLAEAMNEGRHWLFITDHHLGHLRLATVGLGLHLAGVGGLRCGLTEFINLPTNHRTRLSFLTVPKKFLTATCFTGILRELGLEAQTDGSQDIVVLSRSNTDLDAVVMFCTAVREGKVTNADPAAN